MASWKVSALSSGLAALGAAAVVNRHPLRSWDRPSFSGSPVNLSEGLVAAVGSLAGAACVGGPAATGATIAIGAGALAGYVDDQCEDRFPAKAKGLKGHLGALSQGKLTSGALKIGLIGVGSACGVAFLKRKGSRAAQMEVWIEQTALVAGTANLVNLLDLRPGRALKACSILALPLVCHQGATSALAASILTTSAVCAPQDLNRKGMLGDLGANAIGASLGMALADLNSAKARRALLGAVVGLTLASERVSFSTVIEGNRVLKAIDDFGRRA